MRRHYAQAIWDGTVGLYSRADRGGDRLLARGMSWKTAERVARLLNEDDRRTVDPRAMASNIVQMSCTVANCPTCRDGGHQ